MLSGLAKARLNYAAISVHPLEDRSDALLDASVSIAYVAVYPVRRKTSSKRSVAKRPLGGAGELGRGYKAREP